MIEANQQPLFPTETTKPPVITGEAYIDPSTGETHIIDTERPFTAEDARELAERGQIIDSIKETRANLPNGVPYVDPATWDGSGDYLRSRGDPTAARYQSRETDHAPKVT